jgi:hypothetical protein
LSTIGERYEIESELGHGGMATVMLARDLVHDRYVAVKILRAELAGALSHQRFLREIRVVAGLQHPHIVPLYDSGVYEGCPYYVMPHIEGESLRARLDRDRQLSISSATQIATNVASALAYAHSRGVVHRDIKPENILLAGDQALVADFGIARAVAEAAGDSFTSTGLAVGTPAYMSPEQASGEHEIDGRTDIYSLGCVLFEMLAGVPPFVAATPQAVIARRLAAEAPPVRQLRTSVPEYVAAAVSRALERVPADRFASAAEMGMALSPPALDVPRRPSRPWPRAAVVGVALLIVTGAAVVASRWSPFRGEGSTSLVAKAKAMLGQLRLGDARRSLDAAVASTPEDPIANLWLAQTGALLGSDSAPEWRHAAQLAAAHAPALASDDSLRAVALAALANERIGDACTAFRQLAGAASADLTARLTLADCMAQDNVVVRDRASKSGWRFRTNPGQTVALYEQLLREYPTIDELRAHSYSRLTTLLISTPNSTYKGRALDNPDSTFWSFPALVADTLTYVPYLRADLDVGRIGAQASADQAGITHNRGVLREITEKWAHDFPRDAVAHMHFAEALENTGEIALSSAGIPSALDETRLARRLTPPTDTSARLSLAALEFRLDVKSDHYVEARAIADTLLAEPFVPPVDQVGEMAGIAAVTGHLWHLVDYARREAPGYDFRLSSGEAYRPPAALGQSALELLAYSAMGAPIDSIQALNHRLEMLIEAYTSAQERSAVHEVLLTRPLSLAAPVLGPEIVSGLSGEQSYLVRLEQHLDRRDRAKLADDLRQLSTVRKGQWPGGISSDATYLEAWVRASSGDTAGAIAQIDAALNSLPTSGSQIFNDLAKAAALPRMLTLGADLASKTRSPLGARWAAAVCDLWIHADDPLKADWRRMCDIEHGDGGLAVVAPGP